MYSKDNKPPSVTVKQLEQEARNLYEDGNISGSLRKLQLAFRLSPSDRLRRRIDRVQSLLAQEAPKMGDIDQLIAETTSLSIHDDKHEVYKHQVLLYLWTFTIFNC